LEKHTPVNFRHNESLMARLIPFLQKEAAEKEAANETVEKEEEEEDQEAWS
jgi:hypothetical protein